MGCCESDNYTLPRKEKDRKHLRTALRGRLNEAVFLYKVETAPTLKLGENELFERRIKEYWRMKTAEATLPSSTSTSLHVSQVSH